jgi:hypothetical protein
MSRFENILQSADFVGRISAQLNLKELPLSVVKNFQGSKKISTIEMIRILCITGCIPKYLEEINYNSTAAEEIKRLCFSQEGFLFNEFEKIFNDIFQKRSNIFKKILKTILVKKLSAIEIAASLGQTLNSDISNNLKILVLSGFVARDYVFNADGIKTKKSVFRIKDNYLRFYLKYIEPRAEKIQLANEFSDWDKLFKQMDSILGIQFENLILNHLPEVIRGLKIPLNSIQSASPYFQTANTKNRGSCQIDLLIQCDNDIWYLCEFKLRKKITSNILNEMKKKSRVITRPKKIILRTALVYYGEIDQNTLEGFDRALSFDKLL